MARTFPAKSKIRWEFGILPNGIKIRKNQPYLIWLKHWLRTMITTKSYYGIDKKNCPINRQMIFFILNESGNSASRQRKLPYSAKKNRDLHVRRMMWNVEKKEQKMFGMCVRACVRECAKGRTNKSLGIRERFELSFVTNLKKKNFFFKIPIDVSTIIRAKFKLSNWNFHRKCNFAEAWCVLHLAKIDKLVLNKVHCYWVWLRITLSTKTSQIWNNKNLRFSNSFKNAKRCS